MSSTTWTVQARLLADALERILPVAVDHRLSHEAAVEVSVEPGALHVRAANQAMEVRVMLPCQADARTILAMPARTLRETVRVLPGDIKMTQKEDAVVLTMESGAFRTTLHTTNKLPPARPPVVEEEPHAKVILPVPRFRAMLEAACSCVVHDASRPGLNGFLLELEQDRLRMIGTNGFQLVSVWEPAEPLGSWSLPARTAIMPALAARTTIGILRMIEATSEKDGWVTVTFGKTEMEVTTGPWRLRTEYQPGPYPDWRKAVETSSSDRNAKTLTVDRGEVIAALRRMTVLAPQGQPAIDCLWSDGLLKLSTKSDLGQAEEEVPAAYKDEAHSACFNPRFLLDVLEVFSTEQVGLSQGANAPSPLVLAGKDDDKAVGLVMPLKK